MIQSKSLEKKTRLNFLQNRGHKYSKSQNLNVLKRLQKKKKFEKNVKNQKINKINSFRQSFYKNKLFSSKIIKKNPKKKKKQQILKKSNFKFHMIIGRGGFGKVWVVTLKDKKKYYALKEMSKTRIIIKKSIKSVLNEKHILTNLNNTYIVNMINSFQDRKNLYLLLDLLTGGDLRFHICYQRKFSEKETKFFAACIILALEHIHKNKYIHRDIKPENLVFDEKGFLKLTDFGIARKFKLDNSKETSGTPGYMAPEVMIRSPHSYGVDHYALGVIIYECMLGKRPYNGRSRKEIRDKILSKQVVVKDIPRGWSCEAVDFVNRLIQRKPHRRLGYLGNKELLKHKWFNGFDWKKMRGKGIKPVFKPNVKRVFRYLKNLTEDDEILEFEDKVDLRCKEVQKLFRGYDNVFEKENLGVIDKKVVKNLTSKKRGLNLKISKNSGFKKKSIYGFSKKMQSMVSSSKRFY